MGKGREDAAGPNAFDPFTLIDGTAGPPTLIDGIGGVTDTEGPMLLRPREGAGDSLTEIVGILGVTEIEGILLDPDRFTGDSLTDMFGIDGIAPIVGAVVPLFSAGVSLTDILGMGGVTPIDGTLA